MSYCFLYKSELRPARVTGYHRLFMCFHRRTGCITPQHTGIQREHDHRHDVMLFFYGPFSPSAERAMSLPAAYAGVLLSSTPIRGRFLFDPHCAVGFFGATFFRLGVFCSSVARFAGQSGPCRTKLDAMHSLLDLGRPLSFGKTPDDGGLQITGTTVAALE